MIPTTRQLFSANYFTGKYGYRLTSWLSVALWCKMTELIEAIEMYLAERGEAMEQEFPAGVSLLKGALQELKEAEEREDAAWHAGKDRGIAED